MYKRQIQSEVMHNDETGIRCEKKTQWIHSSSTAVSYTHLYNVTAQDTNGCTASEEIAINNAGGPGLNLISATQVSCNGLSNGSIIVLGTGGSGTLQYSIDGGANYQASGRFDNLVAGDYSVMVKDADGCSQYVEVTIIQPEALFLTAAEQMVSCYGGSNGQINVSSASGGLSFFFHRCA